MHWHLCFKSRATKDFFPTKTGKAFAHLDERDAILNWSDFQELAYFYNINVLKWVAREGELQEQNQNLLLGEEGQRRGCSKQCVLEVSWQGQ